MRALVLLLLAACGVEAPAPDSSPEGVRWHVQRALVPDAGGLSTAGIPSAEIAAERRPVLAAPERLLLRWREPLELEEPRVRVETPLPAALAAQAAVRVDAWISVRDPADRDEPLLRRRGLDVGRWRFPAAPQLVDPRVRKAAVSEIEVPEAAWGTSGLLSVVARPLPETASVRWQTRAFEVRPGAQLRFGYGVAEPGWDSGWPAVRFTVSAEGGDAPLFEDLIDPADRQEDRRWFDASLDLAGLAGRSVRFVFEAEALDAGPRAMPPRSFPLVSNPEVVVEVAVAPSEAGTPRNLVLVSLDTLRAKSLRSYGHARDTSPQMDRRLAATGALVRQVVAPRPFTPPSHATIFTGLSPCMHGVENRHGVLPPDQPTLTEILRSEGYRTAAFTENAYVVAGAGFARGFDSYRERRSEESAAPGFGRETFAAAESWLSQAGRRPFFLFVHTYQVHHPYRPPSDYASLFEGDGIAPGEFEEDLRNYEREVRLVDDLLARFLDALEARGLAARTIVAVTSDHGEAFGEHHWKTHGFDAHDEALLVPLLVRAPGLVPPGTVVEEQVGLVDLAPTLLDLLGLPPLPDPAGRSFAARLRGGAEPFAESPLVSRAATQISVRTSRIKFIEGSGKQGSTRLYDLARDPGERDDRSGQQPEAVAAARAQIAEHRANCEAWLARHERRAITSDPGDRLPGWFVNRDEIDAKLRSLGYLE